jgi:hypothetical protein
MSSSDGVAAPDLFCTSCGLGAGDGRFCAGCGSALQGLPVSIPVIPEQATGVDDQLTTVLPPVLSNRHEEHSEPELLKGAWELDPVVDGDLEQQHDGGGFARNRATLIAGSVLAACVLIATGVFGQQYIADADIRNVLGSSTTQFNRVVEPLGSAADLAQFTAAAGSAESAASRLERTAGGLDAGNDRMRSAVRAQLGC